MCLGEDKQFDPTVMKHFREGDYANASDSVKKAWLLFVGRFLTATEKKWEKAVLEMDAETMKKFGEKPTNSANLLVTVPTEALCHYNLREYIPRWNKEWSKQEEQGGDNNTSQSVSDISEETITGVRKKKNPIRGETVLKKPEEFNQLCKEIEESRESEEGKTWNCALANVLASGGSEELVKLGYKQKQIKNKKKQRQREDGGEAAAVKIYMPENWDVVAV